MPQQIWLSPPELTGQEQAKIAEALASNWIAPSGPMLDALESRAAAHLQGATEQPWHALALNSGTAALHLALRCLGIGPGDVVLCPTLSFVASANPIRYVGAEPVFLDPAANSYHYGPEELTTALQHLAEEGRKPSAVIHAHLFGRMAPMPAIRAVCTAHGLPLIEDAAEALGASWAGHPAGAWGDLSIFSLNGNKIITASGGGLLLSRNTAHIDYARYLATQAKREGPAYEHDELGYNYRMSNLLAAVALAQWDALPDKVARRRAIYEGYCRRLAHLPGVRMIEEPAASHPTYWLTTLELDPGQAPAPETIRRRLAAEAIEARLLWKPLHLQPLYRHNRCIHWGHAERRFERGLCLPSGSQLAAEAQDHICETIAACFEQAADLG